MNIEDDFMWVAGNAFSEMRLMVEGAIVLYEGDALPLDTLAKEANLSEARTAFNTLGKALYDLRQHIKELEAASYQEGMRQLV